MVFQELVVEVDESNYEELFDKDLAVLSFISDLQMNCLMCLPMMENIAEEFHNVFFGKVNIEEAEIIAKKCNICSLPTVVFFRNGQQIDRIESSVHEDILREKLCNLYGFC